MTTSTLLRSGASVAAALTLGLGLVACGSDDTTSSSSSDMSSSGGASGSAGGTSDAASSTFGPGCSAVPTSGAGSFDGMVKDPVATAASNNPLLSTLVSAVTKAGLVDTLNGADGLTVFAPTNDAFAKLPKATLKKVLNDKKMLTTILTHHVISGQLDPSSIDGSHTTLAKDKVTVSGDTDKMTVDGASVVCGGVPTANATVYIIDSVLMPQGM